MSGGFNPTGRAYGELLKVNEPPRLNSNLITHCTLDKNSKTNFCLRKLGILIIRRKEEMDELKFKSLVRIPLYLLLVAFSIFRYSPAHQKECQLKKPVFY